MKNLQMKVSWRCLGPLMVAGEGGCYWVGLPFCTIQWGLRVIQPEPRFWCSPAHRVGVRLYRWWSLGLYVNVNASKLQERTLVEVSTAVGLGRWMVSCSVGDFNVLVPAWWWYFHPQEEKHE